MNIKDKCLILGGGGFIGSNLVEGLLENGYEVRVFDKKDFSKKNVEEFLHKIEIFEGDFSNEVDLSNALQGIKYVYHLVSTTIPANSVLNPIYDIESNVVPSIRLLNLCIEKQIKKVIFISSGGTVYGIPNEIPIRETHHCNPISSYGIVKRTIENYFQYYNKLHELDYCVFRVSNPYGIRQNPFGIQGVIPVFLNKIINSETLEIWGTGDVVRDYIYISDVVSVLIKSIEIDTPERVYNLGSGVGVSINELLETFKKLFSSKIDIRYLNKRDFDVPINILDIKLLNNRFNHVQQVSLENGLKMLYKYLTKT